MKFFAVILAFALTGAIAQGTTSSGGSNTSGGSTTAPAAKSCVAYGAQCTDGVDTCCDTTTTDANNQSVTKKNACLMQNANDIIRYCGCVVKSENNRTCGPGTNYDCCPEQTPQGTNTQGSSQADKAQGAGTSGDTSSGGSTPADGTNTPADGTTTTPADGNTPADGASAKA